MELEERRATFGLDANIAVRTKRARYARLATDQLPLVANHLPQHPTKDEEVSPGGSIGNNASASESTSAINRVMSGLGGPASTGPAGSEESSMDIETRASSLVQETQPDSSDTASLLLSSAAREVVDWRNRTLATPSPRPEPNALALVHPDAYDNSHLDGLCPQTQEYLRVLSSTFRFSLWAARRVYEAQGYSLSNTHRTFEEDRDMIDNDPMFADLREI